MKKQKTFSPQELRLLSAGSHRLNAVVSEPSLKKRYRVASVTQKLLGWVVIRRD